tara:strand:+ start:2210 stop:2722 length:513 start_codon:yes stop_codon:yes gene_type:complete
MSYIPPHLRKLEKNRKEEKVILESEEFPELKQDNKLLDISLNLTKSYVSIIEEKEKEEEEKRVVLKEGWSLIKKDKESNKITIINSKKNIEKNRVNLNEKNNSLKKLDKMFDNWDKFRDKENELRGDLSEYYDYKIIIENMRYENLRIEEEIYDYHNEVDNISNGSDEEY